jgi:heme/copper-type cytochrome/quinol oxidase subunit 1
MAGLILMGISVVFRQTTAAYNLDAFRGLIISGAVITGFGMIGVFITLFAQIRQTKAAERNNKNKMDMKMKLAEAEKKYNESQKDIIADNKHLEEIRLKQERKNKKLD